MRSIKNKLTVATCTLLSQHSAGVVALENAWDIDASYLKYSEADDRISVDKYIVKASGDVSNYDRVNLTAVLDTMSGSTPSGAVKQSTVSFTGASGGNNGGGSVETNASALSKFSDTRTALSMAWTHSHANHWTLDYNAAVSVENDYRSYSGAVTVNKETANKEFKFTAGIAGTFDTIFRVGNGNTPVPLSRIKDNLFYGEGKKDTTDIILGLTRIINRRTIGQVNLSYSVAKGYLTDPYKVFSVVDINSNKAYDSFYESRPSTRKRMALTFHLNHQLFPVNDIIQLSYRYYTDDWKVKSHTVRFNYHHQFGNKQYLESGIRLYHQSKAFFYQNEFYAVVENNPAAPNIPDTFPRYISADYRLDSINSITPDLRYGIETGPDGLLRIRLAYMYQSFSTAEFSTNKAIIFQIAYNKLF